MYESIYILHVLLQTRKFLQLHVNVIKHRACSIHLSRTMAVNASEKLALCEPVLTDFVAEC